MNPMYKKTGVFLVLLFSFSCSCKKTTPLGPSPVPYVYVNTQIQTSLPEYTALNNGGGYVYIPGGNKGIIVLQDFTGVFWAFDRTCPYHVTSPCGQIVMGTLKLACGPYAGAKFDSCCASTYGFDGTVTHGPSTYPLKAYRVTATGTPPDVMLTITN